MFNNFILFSNLPVTFWFDRNANNMYYNAALVAST